MKTLSCWSRPYLGLWLETCDKKRGNQMMKKRLTDVAMVCLIGPTHPRLSLPCLKWDQSSIQQQKMGSEFVLSPGRRKKSRENDKSVRELAHWLSFSAAKKLLRGVFSDLSKSKKCHKCCGFFNISFTVICKTKSLIRLDCVPHTFLIFCNCSTVFESLQLLIFWLIRGKAVEFLALLHA